ncbi:hypothetical protein WA158_003789 [Blastocystis sp. Blastoise]
MQNDSLKVCQQLIKFMLVDNIVKRQIDDEENKSNSVDSIDQIYRLFGISTFYNPSRNHFSIRFDTCYKGHYYETFYVFLKPKMDSNSDEIQIVGHTLPPFIPIEEWSKQLSQSNLKLFTTNINIYINSYIIRREQLKEIKDNSLFIKEGLHIYSNQSFSISIISFNNCYITLYYEYNSSLPTTINFGASNQMNVELSEYMNHNTQPKNQFTERIFNEKTKDLFLKNYLNEALMSLYQQ